MWKGNVCVCVCVHIFDIWLDGDDDEHTFWIRFEHDFCLSKIGF